MIVLRDIKIEINRRVKRLKTKPSENLIKFRYTNFSLNKECTFCKNTYKKHEDIFTFDTKNGKHMCMYCYANVLLDNEISRLKYNQGFEARNYKNIKNTIKQSFKRVNIYRKGHQIQFILGCSVDTFKQHIESQFKEGMNWENHSLKGWHYDHIEPISRAKNYDDLLRLNNYKNFQTLWAKENLSKSNKWI